MSDVKKQFANHLKKAMEKAGYEARPAVLEREFNQRYLGTPLTLHGVRKWLLGESLPSDDKLVVLDSWLGSHLRLLRPGPSPATVVEQPRKDWRVGMPPQEREVIETFLALPSQQRKIIREVILAFAAQQR